MGRGIILRIPVVYHADAPLVRHFSGIFIEKITYTVKAKKDRGLFFARDVIEAEYDLVARIAIWSVIVGHMQFVKLLAGGF
ncbi:MAG TPA: hypothetical protein EYP53_10765 [Candidatus Latescibacteria bacterium]|nr:hypothetical protein [Candidatus Latescibacterota bacterium]